MRQVIRQALAVVLCVAFLVPTAWGRCKDYRKGHPWGDGTKPNYVASAPDQMYLIQWRQLSGIPTPVVLVIKVKARSESETRTTQSSHANERNGKIRGGR